MRRPQNCLAPFSETDYEPGNGHLGARSTVEDLNRKVREMLLITNLAATALAAKTQPVRAQEF